MTTVYVKLTMKILRSSQNGNFQWMVRSAVMFWLIKVISQMDQYWELYLSGVIDRAVVIDIVLKLPMAKISTFSVFIDDVRENVTIVNATHREYRLDPDQARQNVRPDLDPNCITL